MSRVIGDVAEFTYKFLRMYWYRVWLIQDFPIPYPRPGLNQLGPKKEYWLESSLMRSEYELHTR